MPPRPRVVLQRLTSRDDGTPGHVSCVDKQPAYFAWSLELPDRGNASGLSCIPAGLYRCSWENHPEHGWCYQLQNVPGRSDILIHPFNLAGSIESGYVKQSLGCLGLGKSLDVFKAGTVFHVEGPAGPDVQPLARDQRGLTDSRTAVTEFNAMMGDEDFDLEIRNPEEAT